MSPLGLIVKGTSSRRARACAHNVSGSARAARRAERHPRPRPPPRPRARPRPPPSAGRGVAIGRWLGRRPLALSSKLPFKTKEEEEGGIAGFLGGAGGGGGMGGGLFKIRS